MTLHASPPAPLLQAASIASSAYGKYTGDGSGNISIPLGFSPNYIKVFNETDNTTWEWNAGMSATISCKNVAGTQTMDTGSAIVSNHVITTNTTVGVYDPGGNGAGDGTIINTSVTVDAPDATLPRMLLATGLNTSAKVYNWVALG